MLPPSLLRDRVFAVGGSLSLIVGFALFGAVMFLPLYFQTVDLGLSHRSRAAPGADDGRAADDVDPLRAADLSPRALPRLPDRRHGADERRPAAAVAPGRGHEHGAAAVFLLVLGLGLGSAMQVLVLAVQNAVDYSLLGAATSGVTMLRGIGGSLGTAVFGTIFSRGCRASCAGDTPRPAGRRGEPRSAADRSAGRASAGRRRAHLPARLRPFAGAGVRRCRRGRAARIRAEPVPAGAPPARRRRHQHRPRRRPRGAALADSLAEVERSLTRVTTARERTDSGGGSADAPASSCPRARSGRSCASTSTASPLHAASRSKRACRRARGRRRRRASQPGLLAQDGVSPELTPAGREHTELLVKARRELLTDALDDDSAERDPELTQLLQRLARELCGEPPVRAAPLAPAAA